MAWAATQFQFAAMGDAQAYLWRNLARSMAAGALAVEGHRRA
jgi:hypothetical protein